MRTGRGCDFVGFDHSQSDITYAIPDKTFGE